MSDDDVIRHYTAGVEEDARLRAGMGRFEYERTLELAVARRP
jgi:hypothetical protein